MANLVVSGVCNMHCAFCFAPQPSLSPAGSEGQGRRAIFLSLETFEERLDFLDRSGVGEARLIGGEPTLHPQFPELVRRARRHGKRIVVFTHGLMGEPALECLAGLPPEDCTVLVNMNAGRASMGSSEQDYTWRREVLHRLGRRALPGFTIYRLDFHLEELLAAIGETGCRPAIRLGLAQPVFSGTNEYLHPKQYREAGRRIALLADRASQVGVRLEFDCGFVRCMFSEDELECLAEAGADVHWRCSPILDIDLDGKAVHCFPLRRKIEIPLDAETTAGSLRRAMEGVRRPYRIAGIYPECSGCDAKAQGECPGGCLAHTIRRFRHTPNQVNISQIRRIL